MTETKRYVKHCEICGTELLLKSQRQASMKKYCDKCLAELRRDRQRGRYARQHANIAPITRTPSPDYTCRRKDCMYHCETTRTCGYWLITGERLGCRAVDCDKYKQGKYPRYAVGLG